MTETKRPVSAGAEEILGKYFPVLDHGFVALVDYMGSDECIERAARVSYGYGTRKASQTRGLLRYLRRHLHTTPSEMVELKFHCCMPMFVARQWIRHRTACLAGDAQLYFDLPGAGQWGRRQFYGMTIEALFRRWTDGTRHPIVKKKPSYLERIALDRQYTIPELARLVDRREETLREYVRSGALAACRVTPESARDPSILVAGRAWQNFCNTEHSAHVDMKPRLARMHLRSCDESSGEIIHTRIVDVWQSGIKPVFRVTLEDGRSLKMSKDHRCLTAQGWLTLEQATQLRFTRSGVISWSCDAPAFAVNGVPAYQDSDWLAARRKEGLNLRQIAERAGISVHSIRKYLKKFGLSFSSAERSRLSGIAQQGRRKLQRRKRVYAEAHLQAIRRARSGPASNFWRGGVSSARESIGRWTTENAKRVHERWGFRCALCGSTRRLNAHHIDPVWHNEARARDLENLMTLCGACHDKLHAANLELALLEAVESGHDLRSFWEGRAEQPRPPGKRKPPVRRLVRSYMRVAKIEFVGEEMTYDLEVSGPDHNFVANGFIVHNSVNEYSGRYSLMPMLFHMPSAEQLQTQSRKNNQGRSGERVDETLYREAIERWNEIRARSASAYEWMTSHEVARELARIDLPLSTYTQWYWKIDLHNLLHFLKLRVDAHAQWEIQEYGRVMAGMLKKLAPHSYEAWIDYDVCGARMSRMELDVLRKLLVVGPDGIRANSDAVGPAELAELGLSKREVEELVTKLSPLSVPDFELDLRRADSPEAFAERMARAVPKVDKPPSEG
jgi:thymidylate synthase (FAD)